MNSEHKSLPFLIPTMGIAAISSAAVLIKLCQAPPLTIALYRTAIAALFYSLVLIGKKNALTLHYSEIAMLSLSGLFLSLHFASWIASLHLTSVASSVILVTCTPIFVVIAERYLFGAAITKKIIIAILLAMTGALIVGSQDFGGGNSVKGNLLALAGALFASGYFLIGKKMRKTLPTSQYVTVVYSSASLFLLLFVIFTRTPLTGFRQTDYLLLLAISLGPQVIGHTSLNWALGHMTATTVTLFTLCEPLGASVLAYFILQEKITLLKIIGGIAILSGVGLVVVEKKKPQTINPN